MYGCHDDATEVALKALIRHLVLSFPDTAILSRQVGDRYHVFVIVPYAGGPEKTIQAERAWLDQCARSIETCERLLDGLDLPRLFLTRDRVELRYAASRQLTRVTLNSANEGWTAEPVTCTV